MKRYRIGDEVQIVGLPHSQWQGRRGTIVEIFEHGPYEEGVIAQECAVDIAGQTRWFMARHLAKCGSTSLTRFFRAEVLDRWQLESVDVTLLTVDREGLILLLRDRFQFAGRRAGAEADDFLIAFNNRIASAMEPAERHDLSSRTAA